MLESWKRFIAGQAPGPNLSRAILESWERCRAFEVDYARAHLRRVPMLELRRILDRDDALVRAARPHLTWALEAMRPLRPVVITLGNADGIVVESVGNVPEVMAEFGLVPGYDWSEKAMGTNGIGTAIAAGEPVAVVGAEHYIATWHDHTCVGAPIRTADGRIAGAVDISTSASESDPARLLLSSFLAHCIARDLGSGATFPDRSMLEKAATGAGGAAIERHAAELSDLADRLVDAAHLSSRRRVPARSTVELPPVLERLARSHRNLSLGEGARQPIAGSWDATRLEQALAQLVRSAGRDGADVELRVAHNDDRVRIAVRGNGNAGHAQSWNVERTGPVLGVWIARQIAYALGGVVEELAPGRSEYLLELPLSA